MYKRYLEPSWSSLNDKPTKYILKKLKLSGDDSIPTRTYDTTSYECHNNISEIDEIKNRNITPDHIRENVENILNDDEDFYHDVELDDDDDESEDLDEDDFVDAEEYDAQHEVGDHEINGSDNGSEECESDNDHKEYGIDDNTDTVDDDDFFTTIGDGLIHPNLNCKISDAVIMILSFFLRHGLTWVALEDMLSLFDSMLGEKSHLPKTKYFFKKVFGVNQHVEAVFHIYCKNCQLYIDTYKNLKDKTEDKTVKRKDLTCQNCNAIVSLHRMNDGHFFIQLPIKKQLENKIKNLDILNYNTQGDSNSNCIRDLFDGKLYKWLKEKIGNGKLITLTLNTDGARVFKSKRKSSVWPIQFFINEVSPSQRFKLKNIILSGIWFGKDPDFHLYMKPFINELKELNTNKIKIDHNNNSFEITVRGFIMAADTPARSKIATMKLFNGRFGCTYCLHPGEAMKDSASNNSKYPVTPQYEYNARTHLDTVTLMNDFWTTGESSFGITGVSPLLGIIDFDLIRGIPIDYMHCVLEGVTDLLMDLWFDSTNHFRTFYINPRGTGRVDKNIEFITPPRGFKSPRPIGDRKFWKANELRNWLLFFAAPCLKDVLKEKYFQHFCLLSESIFILLKTNISMDDLKVADINLKRFVINFETLYGKENMMYNVHLLKHLVECVRNCGPLWAYSTFNFESNNGVLLRHVNGTTNIEHQILSKYIYRNALNSLKTNSEKASEYIKKLENTRVKNSKKIGEVTLFGKSRKQDLNSDEQLILQQQSIIAYNKFFYLDDVYYSTFYKLTKKTNDTVVCLKNGSFGQIVAIYEKDEAVFVLLKKLQVEPDDTCPKHLHRISRQVETYESFQANEISEKCVLISTSNEQYLSLMPNKFESD